MLSITAQDQEAFLTFKWRKPYSGMKLFISTWIFLRSADFCEGHQSTLWKKQMCGTESREEEILKALEQHQTGKTPTHNRAEKALRSSRASLNGSLWANCTNPPTPQPASYFSSPHKSMGAEWTSGRTSSLSHWSFHFAVTDSSPKCCHIYLPCDISASCFPFLSKPGVT